jgi:hydrogen peroxide-dependent heme synthase
VAVSTQHEPASRLGAFPAGLAYTAFAAYRAVDTAAALPQDRRTLIASQALRALAETRGVALRGTYDTSGYRADADLLIWCAAPGPEALQEALAAFRQTDLGATLEPFWSGIGVHRDTDFPRNGPSAYFRGEGARRYLSLCRVSQSPDWYMLDTNTRRRLLTEYGRAVRDYPDVRTNSLNAFGLGDEEWLLAFESEQLVRIVDMLRHLRATESRRYLGHESTVITGVRRPLSEIVAALP